MVKVSPCCRYCCPLVTDKPSLGGCCKTTALSCPSSSFPTQMEHQRGFFLNQPLWGAATSHPPNRSAVLCPGKEPVWVSVPCNGLPSVVLTCCDAPVIPDSASESGFRPAARSCSGTSLTLRHNKISWALVPVLALSWSLCFFPEPRCPCTLGVPVLSALQEMS